MKNCSKCGKDKVLSEFGKFSRSKDGLKAWCKSCVKLYNVQHHQKNKTKHNEQSRAYHLQNKERMNALGRANAAANRERERERALRAYYKNPNKYKIRARAREMLLNSMEELVTPEEIEQMFIDQQGLCAYCECHISTGYHIDHMLPLSRGGQGDWSNIALTCPFCNLSKKDSTPEEYVVRINR